MWDFEGCCDGEVVGFCRTVLMGGVSGDKGMKIGRGKNVVEARAKMFGSTSVFSGMWRVGEKW